MSEYNIYNVPSWTVSSLGVAYVSSQSGNEFSITAQNFFPSGEEDVVKIGFTILGIVKYVYAIQIDQIPQQQDFVGVFSFDGNVYGDLVSSGTFTSFEYYIPDSNDISIEIDHYNISPRFTVSTYGKEYIPYNFTEAYNISVPQKRLIYNDKFKSLYNNYNEKVLVDICSFKAYKVSPTDLSTVAVNGKIKSALNFNVIIK